jgi:hypothetical protein
MPFFPKVELMRFKTRPDARNFAEVAHSACSPGIAPVFRSTKAALADKKAKRFEAVA